MHLPFFSAVFFSVEYLAKAQPNFDKVSRNSIVHFHIFTGLNGVTFASRFGISNNVGIVFLIKEVLLSLFLK